MVEEKQRKRAPHKDPPVKMWANAVVKHAVEMDELLDIIENWVKDN